MWILFKGIYIQFSYEKNNVKIQVSYQEFLNLAFDWHHGENSFCRQNPNPA